MEPNQQKKKSKQNVTRDIEVKNSLAITIGVWGGDSGERSFSGSTIKETWKKTRRRVEVGEGGGFSWGGVE